MAAIIFGLMLITNELSIYVYEKLGFKKVKPTMYLMEMSDRSKYDDIELIIKMSEESYKATCDGCM